MIPPNVAPLNFSVPSCQRATALFRTNHFSFEISSGKKGSFTIPVSKWKKLLSLSVGKHIEIPVSVEENGEWIACKPFHIYVANELVDPSWHPSGRFAAFSVNKTTQDFHPTQRVKVFDLALDMVVYDIEERVVLSVPAIFPENHFETFPTFPADGKTLYYCTAAACVVPCTIQDIRYSLCSISFDPETKLFGDEVGTLYNAGVQGRYISFPRVSPDDNYLICTFSYSQKSRSKVYFNYALAGKRLMKLK